MRFNEFRDPADQEPAYDKDFKQDSLFNQLGKVLDSQGNPKPVDTVTTDDNKQFKVTVAQAELIRNKIKDIKGTEEYNYIETFGNENSNGNALYLLITQWEGQKK